MEFAGLQMWFQSILAIGTIMLLHIGSTSQLREVAQLSKELIKT